MCIHTFLCPYIPTYICKNIYVCKFMNIYNTSIITYSVCVRVCVYIVSATTHLQAHFYPQQCPPVLSSSEVCAYAHVSVYVSVCVCMCVCV